MHPPCLNCPNQQDPQANKHNVQFYFFTLFHASISSRRILKFPVVSPSECIAPATLLSALITLARAISTTKPLIQRRNAREAIREVTILLVFFEEIRDRRPDLPNSAVLCFYELHLVLQKIQFMLQDFGRDGAHLWLLIKSEWIANEFRVLIRTLATVLDVLPLAAIDIPAEIKELIDMVAKQARKVKIGVDPIDERIRKDVLEVLCSFENKIAPDSGNLRRILDHFQIQSWTDCIREVRFLEEQMNFESSNAEEKETALLCSLIGFMNYCRCIPFNVSDSGTERKERENDGEISSYLNPEDFQCPISLELMTDPVTVTTGQTYDRESIDRWFKAGNLICPKTGEKMLNTDLVPNTALLNLIRQFCREKRTPFTEPSKQSRNSIITVFPGSTVAAEALRMASVFLVNKLSMGTEIEKNKAALETRLLAKASVFNKACLIEAEAIPRLLKLLSSSDSSTQENAIAALLNLSKHPTSKPIIVQQGGLNLILNTLRNGLKIEARQIAAAILFYISSVEEYQKMIGEMPEAIPALVDLLRTGTFRGKKNAVAAISGLLLLPSNHRRVLAAGAIPNLVNLLTVDRKDLVNNSLMVLATLAEKPEGSSAILMASAIPPLAGILNSDASRAVKDYCISILLSMCINGGAEVVAILQAMHSLLASLYSLLTNGTSRTSRKASSLLNFLHNLHNSSSSDIFNPEVRRNHVVHAQ